ncbi:hypothetical protein ACYSNR_13905 [Enterococcus sp. LJL128]
MSIGYLLIIYGLIVTFIIISVKGCMKIIKNEYFISYKDAIPAKQKFMKKYEKKTNMIIKILFLIWMTVMFVEFIIPGIFDFPNILTGKYQIVEGIALNSAGTSDRKFPKIVTIKDEQTNQTIRLRFYSAKSIEKGDNLKVIYLPHLKRGTLLKHE